MRMASCSYTKKEKKIILLSLPTDDKMCTCCRESRDVIFSPLISALCKTLSGTGVNLKSKAQK